MRELNVLTQIFNYRS